MTDIKGEIEQLRSMTSIALRERYREVFGEESRSYNKDFLWKRIAWRIQAQWAGDLSERARNRADELANDADLRVRMPGSAFKRVSDPDSQTVSYSFIPDQNRRLPMPGAILSRPYKGTVIRVMVLEKGFEFNGEVYRSLTAITRLVTGTRWNGYHFFGLQQTGDRV